MKKILIISESFWSPTKGTAQYALNLINKLKNTYGVHLLVPTFNDDSDYKIDNIILYTCYVDSDCRKGLHDIKARKKFLSYVRKNIAKICYDNSIDCIHIVYGHFVIEKIPYKLDIPVIWTCHNMPPNEAHPPFYGTSWMSNLGNYMYKLLVRLKHAYIINKSKIDQIICVSETTKLDLKKWVLNSKDIRVVNNGCNFFYTDGDFYEKKNSVLKIITVGGIKPHKNIHLIPIISSKLNEIGVKHEWNIIGPVMNENYFKNVECINKKYTSSIIFRGEVCSQKLKEYYLSSDIYVHLSKEEGFCLTILEAASFGLPCVGTNVGAIPEIISSLNNGILVEPDANVIYSAILKFNKDRNLYNHSRSLCDKTFALWGWDRVVKEYISHYNECIATFDK
ncbi:glycosyltransferase family 4 protein [Escherichia coli]|uniref:glycosyltransferase family 4 protein n=1 Tax=Pseudomonadati TaxID=3379134 RepID=UPI0004A0E089|nr:glycosyltransferase family 4 protein [Escherichia coli]EEZ7707460.1 glycosyltransferase family 4 protein [Escherichia coli]EFA9164055.1 glycosyltransferase family 4 protein [Escherichia coli]EFG9798238.1 glycosyltransferase family 4 protein [Escherichia coli]EFL0536401.1 glycosyltransferase family 4 protein [Escherichia coli]EFL7069073.1 glycosyltransferase family 4 protein [Escherichia coli]